MAGERTVLARKGRTSMVKAYWTEAAPTSLNDVDEAEDMGARWEGDELVTYDLKGFLELYEYHQGADYMIDND